MMKMNLIAGFTCVALLSACSSQKITSSDAPPAAPAATSAGASTSDPSRKADDRPTNNSILKSANAAQAPKASYSK